MAQFFSYPYNYLEDYTGDAKLVSDNNHDSAVEIPAEDGKTINFTFEPNCNINSIFILAENINGISLDNNPLGFELDPRLSEKQYLFQNLRNPKENVTSLNLGFDVDLGTGKVYEVFLLEKKIEIEYDSPIQNSNSSSFSEINTVYTQEGINIHEDIYGHRTEHRQYGYRAKYQMSYTCPLQTLEQVRSLQLFREENLNFTFAQNLEVYQDRIFPAHFSSFDLPMSYTLGNLSQSEKYMLKFTIMEN